MYYLCHMNYVINQSLLQFYMNSFQGYATNPDYMYCILGKRVANEETSVKYRVVLFYALSGSNKGYRVIFGLFVLRIREVNRTEQ